VKTPPVAVVQPSDNLERRTRRVPWGLEIEIWQLTNTITIPESAVGAMAASLLLAPLPNEPTPRVPPPFDDDTTIDTPVDDPDGPPPRSIP